MEPLGIISNLRDLWRNSSLESNSPFSDCFALFQWKKLVAPVHGLTDFLRLRNLPRTRQIGTNYFQTVSKLGAS